jgi:hypothetical protein
MTIKSNGLRIYEAKIIKHKCKAGLVVEMLLRWNHET